MIVHDKSVLKLLISELDSRISLSNIKIKRSRLYEIFSWSQGFNTKSAFVSRLPIMLDDSYSAADELLEYIERYGIKSDGSSDLNRSLLENAAYIVQPFPMVAPPNCCFKIYIDWKDGFVYRPNLCEEHGISGTWEEF